MRVGASIRKSAALPFAAALGADIGPVGSRAKLLANHGALRFALNVYCKLRNALAVSVCDLPQVADTCAAAFREAFLLRNRQPVKEFKKRFHASHFSRR